MMFGQKMKKKRPSNLAEFILIIMRDGRWWTDWDLQKEVHTRFGSYYKDSSLTAARRSLRLPEMRSKYGLPSYGEFILKRKLPKPHRGYEYKIKL